MDDLTCLACKEDFNLTARKPRLLPNCGHSFCEACILGWSGARKQPVLCPEDQIASTGQLGDGELDAFPLNYSLFSLLQAAQQKTLPSARSCTAEADSLCPQHGKALSLVCLTDKQPICIDCVLFAQHRDHAYLKTEEMRAQLRTALLSLERQKRLRKAGKDIAAKEAQVAGLLETLKAGKEQALERLRLVGEELVAWVRKAHDQATAEVEKLTEKLQRRLSFYSDFVEQSKAQNEQFETSLDALTQKLAAATPEGVLQAWEQVAEGRLEADFVALDESLTSVGHSLRSFAANDFELWTSFNCPARLNAFFAAPPTATVELTSFSLGPAASPCSRQVSPPPWAANCQSGASSAKARSLNSRDSSAGPLRTETSILSLNLSVQGEQERSAGQILRARPLARLGALAPTVPRQPLRLEPGRAAFSMREVRNIPQLYAFAPRPTPPEQRGSAPKRITPFALDRLLRKNTRPTCPNAPSPPLAQPRSARPDVMDFSHRRLGTAGLVELIAAVQRNKSVRQLLLDGNNIRFEGFKLLLKELADHPSLQKLSLCDNPLEGNVLGELRRQARALPRLTHFAFTANQNAKGALNARREGELLRRQGITVQFRS